VRSSSANRICFVLSAACRLEGRILLARLLQRFEFAALPDYKLVETSLTGTVKPKGGLPLRVRPRATVSA
jgi:cytochrome P450